MESPYYNGPQMAAETYRNTTMHTVHIDEYGDEHQSRISKQYQVQNDMYSEFNIYGLMWTQDEYILYINGQETWRTKWGVSQSPEFLWLSVEIAGETDSVDPANQSNQFTWSGDIRNNPNGTMPVDFVVNYVKVYQAKRACPTTQRVSFAWSNKYVRLKDCTTSAIWNAHVSKRYFQFLVEEL